MKRAIKVAAPAGLVIWIMANVTIQGMSVLEIIATFFDPFARLMGLDGYILTAFILGIPANEIVLPIILMCYLKTKSLTNIEDTFAVGRDIKTKWMEHINRNKCYVVYSFSFSMCYNVINSKERNRKMEMGGLSFLIPTICGILVCFVTTGIYNIFT